MAIPKYQIQKLIVHQNDSVERLFEVMNQVATPRLGSGYAIAVNNDGVATGIITDSDIRKFSLDQRRLPESIEELSRTEFIFIEEGLTELEAVKSLSAQMELRGWKTALPVRFVPVLKAGVPTGVIDSQDLQLEISSRRDQLVVVGLGYVGLTLALAASSIGMSVIGIDSDSQKINSLRARKSYISEPGIENLLNELVDSEFFPCDSLADLKRNPGKSWNFILSVPTPLKNDQTLDTSYIKKALSELMPHFQLGDSIIVRSTVPIGTTRELAIQIEKNLGWTVGKDFYALSAPERTVEGNALFELIELPQIIGGVTTNCTHHGVDLFRKISKRMVPVSTAEASETIKIASNAFRDYSFGFSNYLTKVAHSYNLDVNEIIDSANFGYSRNSIPKPSPGVGGPCLSKDPYLLKMLGQVETHSPIDLARKVNESMATFIFDHLKGTIPELLDLEIVMIGLAFKGIPETNDLRNSPSLDLMRLFTYSGKPIYGWDAVTNHNFDLDEYKVCDQVKMPQVFLVMNNHTKNLDKLLSLLEGNKEYFWVFDPWRLIVSPTEFLRFAPRGFTYLTLSNSMEFLPHA